MRVRHRLALLFQHQRHDARTGIDPLARRLAAGQQALQPGFEAQPVGDDQVGAEQGLGIIRAGFIEVRVGVGTDQIGQFDMLATDFPGHVGKDAEAGHDADLFGRLQGKGQPEGQQQKQVTHGLIPQTVWIEARERSRPYTGPATTEIR